MSWLRVYSTSKLQLVVFMLVLATICGCRDKYPGTAQQAGVTSLQVQAKTIVYGIMLYQADTGKWPSSLSEVVKSGLLTQEDILYPRTTDLVDRRDLQQIPDRVEWIYIEPSEPSDGRPFLIAPLPYTKSMGRRLPKPRRIIVTPDHAVKIIDDNEMKAFLPKRNE